MLLCLLVSVLIACTQASPAIDPSERLDGTDVFYVVDAADLSLVERINVLSFTLESAAGAVKKGANVGLLLGSDAFITDDSDYLEMSLERRLERLTRNHADIERAWERRELISSPIRISTLAESLTVLHKRMSAMKPKPKASIVILITAAQNQSMFELAANYMKLAPYNIRYVAVLVGSQIAAEEFYQITESPCLTASVESAEILGHDLIEQARIAVVLRFITAGVVDIDDEEALCSAIAIDTDAELKRMKAHHPRDQQVRMFEKMIKEDAKKTAAEEPIKSLIQQEIAKNEAFAKEIRALEREAVDGMTVRVEPTASILPLATDDAIEDALIKESIPGLHSHSDSKKSEPALNVLPSREEAINKPEERESKKPTSEKEQPAKETSLLDDISHLLHLDNVQVKPSTEAAHHQARDETSSWEIEHTHDNKHGDKRSSNFKRDLGRVIDMDESNKLKCYRCDGCTEQTPSAKDVMTCTFAESSCFVARIGFGPDSTYVRGCEPRSRCIDVDSPVLTRRCCTGDQCNGAMNLAPKGMLGGIQGSMQSVPLPSSSGGKKKSDKAKNTPRPTTPSTTTSTVTYSVELDPSQPFYNVEVYFVVDFAGLSPADETDLLGLAKKMAADASVLGADVGMVSGTQVKRVSQRQLLQAFDVAIKGRPRKEDFMRRFESDFHLAVPSSDARQRHFNSINSNNPNFTSTIPRSFDQLVDSVLSTPDFVPNDKREVFIVFMTAGDVTPLSAMSIWQTHEKVMSHTPHYITLLIGNKPEAETFEELGENSENPKCLVMRYDNMKQIMLAEDRLSRLLVELVDYVREHHSLARFDCGDFVDGKPAAAAARRGNKRPAFEPVVEEPVTLMESVEEVKPAAAERLKATRAELEENEEGVLFAETAAIEEAPHHIVEIDIVDKKGRTEETILIVQPLPTSTDNKKEPESPVVFVEKPHEARHETEKEAHHEVRQEARHEAEQEAHHEVRHEARHEAEQEAHHEAHVKTKKPERHHDDSHSHHEEAKPAVSADHHVPRSEHKEDKRVVIVIEQKEEEPEQPIVEKKELDVKPVKKEEKEEKPATKLTKAEKEEKEKKPEVEITIGEEDVIVSRKKAAKKVVEKHHEKIEEKVQEKKSSQKQDEQKPLAKVDTKHAADHHNGNHSRKAPSASDTEGKLMCYQCEHCTSAPPSPSSVVACGDGSLTSPNRGVCFIQRIGDKYTRGCIEGYECLETSSDVLTNFCCNSHSLCNDVLPKIPVSASSSVAVVKANTNALTLAVFISSLVAASF